MSSMSGSALSLERLGGGAAYVLRDPATGATLLLGCGEARESLEPATSLASDAKAGAAVDDGSGCDSSESVDGGVGTAAAVAALPTRTMRRYARDLRALMKRQGDAALTAVLIADYRPEASFMLPYLLEKCAAAAEPGVAASPLPPVFLTHGTRAIAPHHLAEYWTAMAGSSSSRDKDKTQLFSEADIFAAFRKTHAVALRASIAVTEHVKVTAYHAGHVAGGCAFYIELGATTVLVARDFSSSNARVLLPMALPRLAPTALLTRSAFAVTVSETKTSMERELVRVVHESVASGGKVVVPVASLGFFHELAAILFDYWRQLQLSVPIYVTDALAMQFPSRFTPLVARTFTPAFRSLLEQRAASPAQHAALQAFDWKRLSAPGAFVLFTAPAGIAHGDSLRAVRACAGDPRNVLVLSERCTPGTLNYALYADPQRTEAAKRLGTAVACGVHYFPCGDEVDAKSIVELVAHVAPQQVLLDAAGAPDDVAFIRTHVLNRMAVGSNASTSDTVTVRAVATDAVTLIDAARAIPLRIHKALFNAPFDVHGMLVAESKRKLLLVTTGNGARRLKKKRHALAFATSWKLAPAPVASIAAAAAASRAKRKKSARAPSAALAFLLSAPAESTDDDEPDEPDATPVAAVDDVLTALRAALTKWLLDEPVEPARDNRWLKVRSVRVAMSPDWEVHVEWTYEDDELAGRVLGIAKQVVHTEYQKMLQ